MALNSPLAGLVLLLVLKICLEVAAHSREHRKAAAQGQGDSDSATTP